MSVPLILACLWLIAANVIGLIPSRKKHWPQAYVLIAVGLPVLGWVVWENGLGFGLVVLVAAASILRWPVVYLMRWARGIARGRAEG
ncbi:MAG: DUF2484 family protein [Silicimonas sp.]|nr:DUF2484 family protein [Silicimonas sp.]